MAAHSSRPLLVLTSAQALYWSCSIISITMTLLAGATLAPTPLVASLPLAILVLTYMAVAGPLAHHMQAHGRRPALIAGALGGSAAGLVFALGLWERSFWLFCLGALLMGAYQASAMAYRFAALDSAPPSARGRAAAWVLSGGILAALAGPHLATLSRELLPVPFLGAYLMVAVMGLIAALLLIALPSSTAPRDGGQSPASPLSTVSWATLIRRPTIRAAVLTTALGHGLMILIMNATPMAMTVCGLSVHQASQVVQWHVLGMFLPGLITGRLVDRWGSRRMALGGTIILLASGIVALSNQGLVAFAVSSALLGIGWNFMMVAGTTLLGDGHATSERAKAQGLMEFANSTAAAAASLLAALALQGGGWSVINGAALVIIALGLAPVLRRRTAVSPQA